MNRTWKTLALASILASFHPAYALAGEQPDDNAKQLKKSVDDLRKTVEALTKKVDTTNVGMSSKDVLTELGKLEKSILSQADKANKALQTQVNELISSQKTDLQVSLGLLTTRLKEAEDNVAALKDELARLRKDLAKAPVPTAGDRALLEQLVERVGTIEKILAGGGPGERKSFASPAITNTARVVLVNQFPEKLLFLVNNVEYFVEPGQAQQIDGVPVGDLTYRVFANGFGFVRTQSTTLRAKETLTVTARLP